jgi:Autographiviridae DNA primase/helicase
MTILKSFKDLPRSKQVPGRDHIPCPNPECGSSDGYTEYDDGHGWCYVCQKRFTLEKTDVALPQLPQGIQGGPGVKEKDQILPPRGTVSLQYPGLRSIASATERFFNVQTEVDADGTPYARLYPYAWGTTKVRIFKDYTTRQVEDKFFYRGKGSTRGVFGRDRFDPGSAKIITIVEGEEDALAAWEMLGGKYPVVSVQSGSTAKEDCAQDREYINSFSRIYLCLDNDDVGKKASKEIARLFDFNKVYVVPLTTYKDANDYLKAEATEAFRNVWYGAKRYVPENIVSTWSEFRDILKSRSSQSIGSYPFGQLQSMAHGFREGEIVLIDAPEGIGKTEFLRAIEYHLLTTTKYNVGYIPLEESKKRHLQGLIGYHLREPLHLTPDKYGDDLLLSKLQELLGHEERLFIYSHFGSDEPDIILDAIRGMVSSVGCKFIFLDHITQVVTGLRGMDDERRVLDYMITRLNMMVQELQFCLILVSHVNDNNDTRGSRLISKAPHFRLSLSRNLESENEDERNTTKLLVRKNRHGSTTGPAGSVRFDPVTFTLSDAPNFKLAPIR